MREINNDTVHENLLKRTPVLAFDENKDYAVWKKDVREKFVELIGIKAIAENACPIVVETEEIVEKDEYTRIRYVFESEKGCFVPCYLLIPHNRDKKMPVCICLQGHSTGFHISVGEKKYDIDDRWLATSTFAIDAVKNGYAVLAIEQRGMGERTTLKENRGKALTCGCYFTAMTALLLGRTVIGERVWDVSKAIDSLEYFARKFMLDTGDITLLGTSGGGTATYYSACFDERIKTAVPTCALSSYRASIGDMWHCSCNYIPGIAKFFDMGELSALIAPRKLLICNGEIDPIFPLAEAQDVYSVIEKIYDKENAANNCKFVVYPDKPHYFDKTITFNELKNLRRVK
ncbi:MAG: alpha/beta hydrolase [Clostridia bacterium]|nr:alpha/beta hydrolase [Clostridia bacterium]